MSLLWLTLALVGVCSGVRADDEAAECDALDESFFEKLGLNKLYELARFVEGVPGSEGYTAALQSTEPFAEGQGQTVFAPTDAAFAELADILPSLTPEDVLNLLEAHRLPMFVPTDFFVESFEGSSDSNPISFTETTAAGSDVEFTRAGGADIFVSPVGTDIKAKVVMPDVPMCPGVIHVVDKVLLPAMGPPTDPGVYGE